MSWHNNGGPAHPVTEYDPAYNGMSLRDWFAGQALASGEYSEVECCDFAARNAYQMADAMLAAREVKP